MTAVARQADPWNVYDELAALGIVLKQRRPGKVYMTCPKCSPTRRKKNAECLEVRVLDNELRAYWQCFHPDCNGWSVTEVHKPFPGDDGRRGEQRLGPRRPQVVHNVDGETFQQTRQRAAAILRRAEPIGGTLAERYLLGRGLDPEIADPVALRFLPSTAMYPPSLVALITDVRDAAQMLGLQFTTLSHAGTKIDRKFMKGSRPKGGVIRLIEDSEVRTELGLSEGTETGLAVMTAMNRAGRMILPVWSALSAGNMEQLPVLAGIERLHIFADRDERGTGQKAAETLATRWREAGREVRIVFPPRGDWNE
jgi:hypothetical protein